MPNLEYSSIEQSIGYTFENKQLLQRAFVHSSYAYEHDIEDNERMEFLGDAILDYIVSEYLYDHYPDMDAGQLSMSRAEFVSSVGLKSIVKNMDIIKHLLMSGNAARTVHQSKKLEANLFEAILCAIYYDGGMNSAREFVMKCMKKQLDSLGYSEHADYKSRLQELCHQRKLDIDYQLLYKDGPDNDPTFAYHAVVNGQIIATGKGRSIKIAQADAARQAYDALLK